MTDRGTMRKKKNEDKKMENRESGKETYKDGKGKIYCDVRR